MNSYLNEDDEEVPNIQLTSRKKSSHQLTCNKRDDGTYSIVVLSMKNQALSGTDGDVVTIMVDVPITMSGTKEIELSNIHLVPLVNGEQGVRIDQLDVKQQLTIVNEGGGETPKDGMSFSIATLALKPGETSTLYVDMTNDMDVCSFQFNIKLPDGLTVVKEYNEDDEFVETISLTDRKKSSHELNFKQTEDGGYFLLAYSLSNATFRGNSGNIVAMKVKAAEDMELGNYGVIISNALLVTPDEQRFQPQDVSGTITIGESSGPDNPSNPDTPVSTGCKLEIPTQTIQAGYSSTVSIDLNNEDEVTAFQFDMELPQGININTMLDEDGIEVPDIQLSSRQKSSHKLTCNLREDGTYSVVAISMKNQSLRDNSGAIVNVNVTAASTLPSGSYPVKLSNIHIVTLKSATIIQYTIKGRFMSR